MLAAVNYQESQPATAAASAAKTARSLRKRRIAELALVAISSVWGLTFVMVQDAIKQISVTAFLTYRFLPATAIVAVIFWPRLRTLSRAGWRWGSGMGVCLGAGYVAQTFALERTSVSNAGFITGLYVVLTPVLGALVFRRGAGLIGWAAAGISALGLALLSGAGSGNLHPYGDGLALVSAVAFSAHIVLTDRAVNRHDVGALLVVQLGVTSVMCLLLTAILDGFELPRGVTVWSALFVTAVIASALGFFIQTYAQRHASAARTALILASEPVFAGAFGYILSGDRLTALGWAGAALIIAAIVAVDAIPRLRPPRPLPEG